MLRQIGQQQPFRRPIEVDTKMPAADSRFLAGGKLEVAMVFIASENPSVEGIVGFLGKVYRAGRF